MEPVSWWVPEDPWSARLREVFYGPAYRKRYGVAPTEGGCWIAADAMKRAWKSGELLVLYETNPEAPGCEPRAHHVVLRFGDKFVDADGLYTEDALIDKAMYDWGLPPVHLGPFDPDALLACDTPPPKKGKKRTQLVKALKAAGPPPPGLVRANPPKGPEPPWLSLEDTVAWEGLAAERGVSEVARSSRGFLTAYKQGRITPWWSKRRHGFLNRMLAQLKRRGEPLWEKDGTPTRRHLALIMWAYSPAPAELRQRARRLATNPPRAERALARVQSAVGQERACYPAAEVVYHAGGGKRAGLTPVQQRHEGRSHWWVRGPEGEVLDPTAGQFRRRVPYDQGRGRGFLTKKPSGRARALAKKTGVKLKKNPDPERLRRREREAAMSGDPIAERRLAREQLRRGLVEDPLLARGLALADDPDRRPVLTLPRPLASQRMAGGETTLLDEEAEGAKRRVKGLDWILRTSNRYRHRLKWPVLFARTLPAGECYLKVVWVTNPIAGPSEIRAWSGTFEVIFQDCAALWRWLHRPIFWEAPLEWDGGRGIVPRVVGSTGQVSSIARRFEGITGLPPAGEPWYPRQIESRDWAGPHDLDLDHFAVIDEPRAERWFTGGQWYPPVANPQPRSEDRLRQLERAFWERGDPGAAEPLMKILQRVGRPQDAFVVEAELARRAHEVRPTRESLRHYAGLRRQLWPGDYEGLEGRLDEIVRGWSLDQSWVDEEYYGTGGYAAVVGLGPEAAEAAVDELGVENAPVDLYRFLTDHEAAIVQEDDQGFVDVEYYESVEGPGYLERIGALAQWQAVEDHLLAADEEWLSEAEEENPLRRPTLRRRPAPWPTPRSPARGSRPPRR